MLSNLVREMNRTGVKISDIAVCIGRSICETQNKIDGITAFTYFETVKIRKNFFPNSESEYLFMHDAHCSRNGTLS